jgi:predicted benzoate:H+ symporter BenE
MVTICVLFHYMCLHGLFQKIDKIRLQRHRKIVIVVLGIFVAHIVEICMFALCYYILSHIDHDFGYLSGITNAIDYIYYSVVVYTSLGFGDIIPHGSLKILTGMETLIGSIMVAWSASFTFFEMQRLWTKSDVVTK